MAFAQQLHALKIEAQAELLLLDERRIELKRFITFAGTELGGIRGSQGDPVLRVKEAITAHPGIRASLLPTATGLKPAKVDVGLKSLAGRGEIERSGLGWRIS